MTPTLITPLAYPLSQYLVYGNIGPYVNGSSWWILAGETAGTHGPLNLVAYKSTDQGVTWVRHVAGPGFYGTAFNSCYHREGSTKVILSYQSASGLGNIKGVVFDMAAGTFGTTFSIPYNVFATGASPSILVELSTGDLAFVWQSLSAGIYKASVSVYSGGSWSSQLEVNTAATDKRTKAVIVDASDRIGIVTVDSVWPYANTYSLTDGYSILNETTMFNGQTTVANAINTQQIGVYDSSTDSIVFCFQRVTVDPNPPYNDLHTASLLIGTPSNNPTWTAVDVYSIDETANPNLYMDFPWIVKVGANWEMYIGYGDTWGLYADGNFQILKTVSSTLSGTWPAPTVYYDLHANPFVPPPYTDNLELMWVNVAGGSAQITCGMLQIVSPSDYWCGVLGFLGSAPVSTKRLLPQYIKRTNMIGR